MVTGVQTCALPICAVHHQRGRLPGLADCHWVDGVGRARLLGAVAPCSVGGEAVMTTRDRDKIIAAAIGCIEGPYDRSRAITITGNEIERLYAIAYEDGRQAEREECVCIYKSLHNLYLDRGYPEQQMAFLIAAIDDFIEAIRARGDMK